MARLGAWYHHCFETRPWATLIATNGTLTLVADALAQSYEREKTALAREHEKILPTPTEHVPWDWHRSGRFLLFGSAMAPLLGEWNHFLEHRFPMRSPTGKIIAMGLVRRVAMDQLLLYVARSPQRTVRPRDVCRLHGHHGGAPHARLAPGQVPRRTSRTHSPIRSMAPRCSPTGRSGLCSSCSTLASSRYGTLRSPLTQLPRAVLGVVRRRMDALSLDPEPKGCVDKEYVRARIRYIQRCAPSSQTCPAAS